VTADGTVWYDTTSAGVSVNYQLASGSEVADVFYLVLAEGFSDAHFHDLLNVVLERIGGVQSQESLEVGPSQLYNCMQSIILLQREQQEDASI